MYIDWRKEEEAKQNAKKYDISNDELDEILGYVRYSDSGINNSLKGGYKMENDDIEYSLEQAEKLNTVIDKLPKFEEQVVYRREEPRAIINNLQRTLNRERTIAWYKKHEGEYIKFPNFLSSRHSKPPIEDKVLITIQINNNTKARNLHEIFDGEHEVIFEPESVFKIVKVNEETFEVDFEELTMDEIPEDEQIIEMDYKFYEK
jgi:hypothetical protein